MDGASALDVLRAGVEAHVFPGASAEAGTAGGAAWCAAVGALAYGLDAPPVSSSTVYDLASLTKPIAATTIAMRLVERGTLDLESPIAALDVGWHGADRNDATVRDLLEHASGLPAWAPLWKSRSGRDAIVAAACSCPLEYARRSRSVYSDLGFIVLGAVLERAGRSALDDQFDRLRRAWTAGRDEGPALAYNPPSSWWARCAPARFSESTEGLAVGKVDDDNARAMGGVAGHAGLFGTASAVGEFARTLLRALAGDPDAESRLAGRDTIRRFLVASSVPGSSRALGWDLMRATSSCGSRMSPSAFGHTGFTGTSLWIDPARDFYAVLLTNRVHPDAGPNDAMQALRRAFHDALLEGAGV